ncbi:NAD(P)/FAD-dependent oxidoreductase (plasmid) [Agrobacterium leguminum]|uniref:NAD(P)/FAD-dependent oxidoreductase n=1 Tax=Agrobacterium leguminum TaxID=2792015 RepID=UPI00272B23A1|nr:NAD(P)/FAD-dependent oxidoreductase [Agrobacterium leguminum]WLE00818.1 NAD(P)/FAD-dependent oxidoreductase [Agrobacterium leguminum]
MTKDKNYDLAIIGAGPAGLFAAYYAGFRGLKTVMFDSLPQVGGQISTMYPEKKIHDVAGYSSIRGADFVANLLEQSQRQDYELCLSESVTSLNAIADGSYELRTDKGAAIVAKAVIIAAGLGKCQPRSLPLLDEIASPNIIHFVPDLAVLDGRDVVVAGGGDSAVDWALAALPRAKSVTVIHRRNRFRAHEGSVKEMYDSGIRIVAPGEVVGYRSGAGQEFLTIDAAGKSEELQFGKFVVALGFKSDLGPMSNWGLNIEGYRIPVQPDMQTCLPRVFAIGDVSEYPGKVRLMAVGFGEASIAVNHAAAAINPGMSVLPGHSTNEG